MRNLSLLILTILVALSGLCAAQPAPEFSVGLGLPELRDYGTDALYDNAAAYLRRPAPVDSPWAMNAPVPMDANRYPLGPASLYGNFGGYAGTPRVTFDGTGSAAFANNLLTIKPPIANLRISFPDSTGATFRAGAVADLSHASVLRFMGATETNNSIVRTWSQRTPPTALFFTSFDDAPTAGMPYEHVADLCNATGSDCWVCIPDQADDDYVTRLADLLRDRLKPSLRVYVEYGNELWNPTFQQLQRVQAAGVANPTLNGQQPYIRAAQQSAFRTKQIADIFRREFGSQSSRVRVVLGGWAANSSWAEVALGWFDTTGLKASDYLYAIAIAPYVGDSWTVPQVDQAGLTVDSLFGLLNAELQGPVSQWIGTHKTLADKYGLRLVAYEGGQGISGAANLDVKLAAQRDPRMGKLQTDLLNLWRDKGGSAFALFYYAGTANQYGAWGLKESADQQHTAKWDAFVAAADAVNGKTPATAPAPVPPLTQPTPPLSAGQELLKLAGQVRSLTAERDALKAQVQALQVKIEAAIRNLQGQ